MPAESAFFRAALEPAPADARVELACSVTGRSGGAGSLVLDLACDGAAMRLYVEAEPAPAGDGFAVGQPLKVTVIRAADDADGAGGRWLRVEGADGRLLLAAAAAGRVDPPDGTAWAAPFAWREAPGTCMVEETDCGATQRGALDLQLSGGAPRRLYDGTSSPVGDKGAFVAYVEAARAVPPGSGCPREFALALWAAR